MTENNKKMPRWAQRLLEKHPDGERPTPENPMPGWLERELRKVPLWYHIREATDDPRFSPPHHLIEDVRRQPDLLRKMHSELEPRFEEIAGWIHRDGIEHVVFIGCGSAYYNSVLGAFVYPRLAGVTGEAVEAWEFHNYYQPTARKTLLVAQSATGGSFEVVDAARRAKEMGMSVLALTNTRDSALEELADETVSFPTGQKTGPDLCVIPTRLVMMYQLALALGRLRGADEAVLGWISDQLSGVPELAERFITEQDEAVQVLARKYHGQSCMLVVGGGPNWFTVLEASLKMEEESSTPCRAYQTADYPHMAISLLRPERTTVVIAPPGPSYERLHACARTARAGGSPVVAFLVEGDEEIAREADDTIVVPGPIDEILFPILGTMVGQLYGYYLGVNKSFNPDCLGTDDIDHARAWLTSFPLGTH